MNIVSHNVEFDYEIRDKMHFASPYVLVKGAKMVFIAMICYFLSYNLASSREKICIQGVPPGKFQFSLLSYRDKFENCYFACKSKSNLPYRVWTTNGLVYAFVVHMQQNRDFSHYTYIKIRKRTEIRDRYDQAPHLTQDTNAKVTTSQLDITNESQEASPFPAGDHKAHINRRSQSHSQRKTETSIKDPQKKYRLGTVSKIFYWRA